MIGIVAVYCFNRPKAISCLATFIRYGSRISAKNGFNRPKAISCLATASTQRIRGGFPNRFNRPKAISCLATLAVMVAVVVFGLVFQSPEGD